MLRKKKQAPSQASLSWFLNEPNYARFNQAT